MLFAADRPNEMDFADVSVFARSTRFHDRLENGCRAVKSEFPGFADKAGNEHRRRASFQSNQDCIVS